MYIAQLEQVITCTCCVLVTFIGAGPSSRKKLKFKDCDPEQPIYERPQHKYAADHKDAC